MLNKFEATGIGLSVVVMVLALYLLRVDDSHQTLSELNTEDQSATVFVAEGDNQRAAVANALTEATEGGSIKKLIIDDVLIGDGDTVSEGDRVTVHYIGTLQSGQQFDNSYVKGEPFTFTVGDGKVIDGWSEGLVGMKVGGQRILIIPPHLAYGSDGFGPIPGNATLVFAIELISIQ